MQIGEVIQAPGAQLGVLEALLFGKAIDEDTVRSAIWSGASELEDLVHEVDGRRVPKERYADDMTILGSAIAKLGQLDVTAEQLATIEHIGFDGGGMIYLLIESESALALGMAGHELDTGGESDIYLFDSFAGLEKLPNLKTIDLDGHGFWESDRDQSPLDGIEILFP